MHHASSIKHQASSSIIHHPSSIITIVTIVTITTYSCSSTQCWIHLPASTHTSPKRKSYTLKNATLGEDSCAWTMTANPNMNILRENTKQCWGYTIVDTRTPLASVPSHWPPDSTPANIQISPSTKYKQVNLWRPLRTQETRKKIKRKKERCCSYEQIYRTMGLISADRSNKATLLLTIPRSIKVVCNGFISSNIWN